MIKKIFKKIVKSHYWLYLLSKKVIFFAHMILNIRDVHVENKGCGKLVIDSTGKGNTIIIGKESFLNKTVVRIRGNNNKIVINPDCYIGEKCSFWMEGNNITINIGANTTFTHTVHFCAQEDNSKIEVGEDCMFSNSIIVRTSDSHPIYDLNTNVRMNSPKSVTIGKHVWIAPKTTIMKGAIIEDGAIIGSNTIVTKHVPSNSLAVGMPSKVVKTNVRWTRESLF